MNRPVTPAGPALPNEPETATPDPYARFAFTYRCPASNLFETNPDNTL